MHLRRPRLGVDIKSAYSGEHEIHNSCRTSWLPSRRRKGLQSRNDRCGGVSRSMQCAPREHELAVEDPDVPQHHTSVPTLSEQPGSTEIEANSEHRREQGTNSYLDAPFSEKEGNGSRRLDGPLQHSGRA
ncbi:hypothetical protein EVG20_g6754 [Dentipellis fragilis]|uniref:Uncharacterized protein n=1 Tax=Dentipellis fragilis TaxID=205917 RepID=A0A4Y9YLF7_9AGAM|nr:hypothetical protein EVG20_g6754 [Dentipellis fragilis]